MDFTGLHPAEEVEIVRYMVKDWKKEETHAPA